ncbi:MAG: hypothetical protein NW215_07505 [Hyphomicrobiales bacterium]|nr:hypothetical protein [Hyphomicrobiales bacterium]
MSQQILSVLEADACCSQPSAERMFEVMHAKRRQAGAFSRTLPSRSQHSVDRLAAEAKHVGCMNTPSVVNDLSGYSIEQDQPFIAILDLRSRDDEDRFAQLRHIDFPLPAQSADLAITAPAVHGK